MLRGLSPQNLKKLDRSGILGLLLDFPQQLKYALILSGAQKVLFEKRDFKTIAFAGMGGSAMGGGLVKSYLFSESKLPVFVLREYDLPACCDSESLLFVISYSGNTEETLSIYEQARERAVKIIAISSGGLLKDRAIRDGVTFIEVPKGAPPRFSLGYFSVIPLVVLAKLGLIKEVSQSVNEASSVLEELRKNCLDPHLGKDDNVAKAAAAKLVNKLPFFYSASAHFDVCVERLRAQLAENAKALSCVNFLPEMNHNEIEGWQNPKKLLRNFAAVFLRDSKMHPRVAKRMDISASILAREGVKPIEIWSKGDGLLSRIFSLIYIGDFISYYLAALYGEDPETIDKISYIKKELIK